MAIVGKNFWYHPRWFSRRVPDPDIEGAQLEKHLAERTVQAAGAGGTTVR
jgi:RND superfamily putative drug exporter